MTTIHSELMEQFKLEMDAFCRYKDILSMTDGYLKDALEEIMCDEYLHAKFLRHYLIKTGSYVPSEHVELEKRFSRIENEI